MRWAWARLSGAWAGFWFAPGEAFDLGLARMLFFAAVLALGIGRGASAWGGVAEAFWEPVSGFALLRGPPPIALLRGLEVVYTVALVAGAAGLLARASAAIAFATGLVLLGIPSSFGQMTHRDMPALLTMAVLALARSGDACSLDALARRLRRSRAAGAGPRERLAGPEYRWPVQLIRAVFALAFFAAGYAKLRHAGLDWALSENMRRTLLARYYVGRPPTGLGLALADQRWACVGLGLGTLLVETLAPLALVSRAARAVIVPGLAVMQMAIWLVLGIRFAEFIPCYIFWIPWSAALRALGAPRESSRL
jgi:hypothetical protein